MLQRRSEFRPMKRPRPSDARSAPARRQAPVERCQERVPRTKCFMDWTANYFIIVCVSSQLICPFLFSSLFLIVDTTWHRKDTVTPPQTRKGGSQIKHDSAGPEGIGVSTDATTVDNQSRCTCCTVRTLIPVAFSTSAGVWPLSNIVITSFFCSSGINL
jgi:hypothetical protein